MSGSVTYKFGSGLYINMTNRCSNDCGFCLRRLSDSVGDADSLWLDAEPTREEIYQDIQKHDLTEFSEIVFCGYGEPTERLEDMLWICKRLRETGTQIIRLNTNGHASLIAGHDTAPMFSGLVDTVSISLNAADAAEYDEMCKPVFGTEGYYGMLDFALKVKEYVPNVILSVVGGTTDVESCRKIADDMGLPLRVR